MQPERRRSLRVPDSRTIAVVCGDAVFDAHLTNISTLGALVTAPPAAVVAVGQTVRLRFPVATGGKLVAEGRIVRVGNPAGSIAFAFDRPLNEFPVEQAPEAAFTPAKSNPLAAGCVITGFALALGLAVGALILAFKAP